MACNSAIDKCAERKHLLQEITNKNEKLKKLMETVTTFVECSSFISNNEEIASVNREMHCFTNYAEKMLKSFDELNAKLYNLDDDSDIFPVVGYDANEQLETETFKEKKELSVRSVIKAKTYIQNPIYMHSALKVANNVEIAKKVGKFMRRQWIFVKKMLVKVFPEEESELPTSGQGLDCPEEEVFQNLQMPLIRLFDQLHTKLTSQRMSNARVHDNFFTVFKLINEKYESLFNRTIWRDEEWLKQWGTPETKATTTH